MCILDCSLVLLFQEYIHRVGRTARGEGAKGKALLVLIPEELQFIRYLKVRMVIEILLWVNQLEF